jgi:hypothetical protein
MNEKIRERKQRTRAVVGIVSLVGFFGMLTALVFKVMPSENKPIIQTMVGFLGGFASAVVMYYYGDSQGKDDAQ